VGADLWLKHWMPMIMASPDYQRGKLLVVLAFDEAGVTDARACPADRRLHPPLANRIHTNGAEAARRSPPAFGRACMWEGGGRLARAPAS
jgi:phosphatidylinositol-3-phosphatase